MEGSHPVCKYVRVSFVELPFVSVRVVSISHLTDLGLWEFMGKRYGGGLFLFSPSAN